jgi:hypothetical protein
MKICPRAWCGDALAEAHQRIEPCALQRAQPIRCSSRRRFLGDVLAQPVGPAGEVGMRADADRLAHVASAVTHSRQLLDAAMPDHAHVARRHAQRRRHLSAGRSS